MISRSQLPAAYANVAFLSLVLTACSSRYTEPKSPPRAAPPAPTSSPQAEPPRPTTVPNAPGPKNQAVEDAVAAKDRTEEDRALDAGRKPLELLSFFGIQKGMRVLELMAGGGYTTELVARVVGPDGEVFGQNSPFVLQRFAEKPWSERLQKPVMARVHRLDQEIDAPLPPEVRDLDAVLLILFYHDTVWQKADRVAMNRSVYASLKPGGLYGIVDHSARSGDGLNVTETLHRIEPSIVRLEVEKAGFVFEGEADFLKSPSDTRDWSASPRTAGERRGTSDRFVYLFRKPSAVTCSEPRSQMCTREYRPVCATVDTGVRCVSAPCPEAQAERTYANACSACADAKVIQHVPGACPGADP